ncbi:TetR/AcrR family transcriptional regulator [Nocardia sp. NPDC051990]|uniref:TetR/AcrR family transcriptional regulator n=1 Tax=Nocardia sp. NPDC051990 TaxID=3155285 RepID=UPI00343EB4ED
MSGNITRPDRTAATKEAILSAAEQLFAEHGVFAISNRQVSEAAGQGNNAAVGYHFGTKTDLVRAIVRKHTEPIEEHRMRLLADHPGSTELRDLVSCLVRPVTEHYADLGSASWYARFGAQVMTDPTLRIIMREESLSSPSLQSIVEGFDRCLSDLPPEVRQQRGEMARYLMVHGCAEFERTLADGRTGPRANWYDYGTGLIDAIVGIWQAPVTGQHIR